MEQPTKFPYRFPVAFLPEFEKDPQMGARKILTYVRNHILNGKHPERAKEVAGFDFAPYEEYVGSRRTYWWNLKYLLAVANGRGVCYEEIAFFLFLCAVHSVLPVGREYVMSNWKIIGYRAAGYNEVDETKELSGIPQRLGFYRTKGFKEKLVEYMGSTGICYHADKRGMRGFLLYSKNADISKIKADFETKKQIGKKERNSVQSLYLQGVLESVVNKILGANEYTDDFGVYLCKNVKNDMRQELPELFEMYKNETGVNVNI